MKEAIEVLERRLQEVQENITAKDTHIGESRRHIQNMKAGLARCYKQRDELVSAIDRLRRAR